MAANRRQTVAGRAGHACEDTAMHRAPTAANRSREVIRAPLAMVLDRARRT
jgi:hypothetical protein